MAVRWDVDKDGMTRGTLYHFDPEEISTVPGANGRFADPDIEWMIADIRERGQETPVTVRSDGGKPVLVFGHQRLRAIRAINGRWPAERRQIACVFKQLTEEEAFRSNIAENRMRNETTPVDDAHNIKRLMNVYGYTEPRVVSAYFPSLNLAFLTRPPDERKAHEDAKRWVRERMALIGLTPVAEQAVRDGKVKLHTAIALNKLPAAKQEEVLALGGWVKGTDVATAAGKPAPKPRKKKESKAVSAFAAQNNSRLINAIGMGDDDLYKDDNEPEQDIEHDPRAKPFIESLRNLGSEMLDELADALWQPLRDKPPAPELIELCDAVLEAAAQASAKYDFAASALDAMEAYRSARVKA